MRNTANSCEPLVNSFASLRLSGICVLLQHFNRSGHLISVSNTVKHEPAVCCTRCRPARAHSGAGCRESHNAKAFRRGCAYPDPATVPIPRALHVWFCGYGDYFAALCSPALLKAQETKQAVMARPLCIFNPVSQDCSPCTPCHPFYVMYSLLQLTANPTNNYGSGCDTRVLFAVVPIVYRSGWVHPPTQALPNSPFASFRDDFIMANRSDMDVIGFVASRMRWDSVLLTIAIRLASTAISGLPSMAWVMEDVTDVPGFPQGNCSGYANTYFTAHDVAWGSGEFVRSSSVFCAQIMLNCYCLLVL